MGEVEIASNKLEELKSLMITVIESDDEKNILLTLTSILSSCVDFMQKYDGFSDKQEPHLEAVLNKIRLCRNEAVEKIEQLYNVSLSSVSRENPVSPRNPVLPKNPVSPNDPVLPNNPVSQEKQTNDHDKDFHLKQRVLACETQCLELWSEIAGSAEAKQIFKEAIIFPSKFPNYFKGIRAPWGTILLYGPPGTGKTVLAKASAKEASFKFFMITASTIASKYVGEGERIVKTIFDVAISESPCILFMDEVDSIMTQRGGVNEHEASKKIKTEILVQLDRLRDLKVKNTCSVTFVCACNFPWSLDQAFLRRIEKQLFIKLPDQPQIEEILKIVLKETEISDNVDFSQLSGALIGYSGADIKRVCRDAAMQNFRKIMNSMENENEMATDVVNDMIHVPIQNVDFESALLKTKRSVSKNLIDQYDNWSMQNSDK